MFELNNNRLSHSAAAILSEIYHHLLHLAATGKTAVIDLRALPLSADEKQVLLEILGRGEVEAKLIALGSSFIWETKFSGVWIVEHRNTAEEQLTLQIEIATIPMILCAQPEAITEAAANLKQHFELITN